MEIETARELLCFSSDGAYYAVDFLDIVEICIHIRLQFVPRQPEHFCGVFYYKGTIVPVVWLGGRREEMPDGNATVLVVKGKPDLFGILLPGSPWMERVEEKHLAKDHSGAVIPERWAAKGIYWKHDRMICLLDIDRSKEMLSADVRI